MTSNLTPTDKENFWIRVYLGASQDLIGAAIDRAYRDFNRTQHGYAKLKTADSYTCLKEVLRNVTAEAIGRDFISQTEFDEWHEVSCDYLINSCLGATSYKMSYGQAQKWINMSLKYMYALGDDRVPGISRNYHYFHIPIDNIIQDILVQRNIARFKESWSRIATYKAYLDYQIRFRAAHPNEIPLDVEFKLFNQLN